MTFSDVLAATALIVWAISVWLSHKANRESTRFAEREAGREFSRERSEFLVRIERSTKLFERVESRLRGLLANIKEQPSSNKLHLKNASEELKSDLKYLEGCLLQSRILWDENSEMSHDGLAHHKARHLKLLEDDGEFAAQALERAAKIEESLNVADFLANPIIG